MLDTTGTPYTRVAQIDPSTGQPISGGSGGTDASPSVVRPQQSSSFTPGQVAMSTTSAQILPSAGSTTTPREIKNFGTTTVFIGPTSGVTASAGYPLLANEAFTPWWTGAIFGITASGTSTIGTCV